MRFYINNADGSFRDGTRGANLSGQLGGLNLNQADYDNDRDQDICAVMGGAYSGDLYRNALFENPGNKNKWITLKLEGATGTNRSAVGAGIAITTVSREGSRKIYRTVNSGGSFGSNSLRQHIGLGHADSILSVSIAWPDKNRSVYVYQDVPLNLMLLIRQGDPNWTMIPVKSLRFDAATHSLH